MNYTALHGGAPSLLSATVPSAFIILRLVTNRTLKNFSNAGLFIMSLNFPVNSYCVYFGCSQPVQIHLPDDM